MPLVAHPVRSLWGSQPRCARCVCEWLHRKWDGAPTLQISSRSILSSSPMGKRTLFPWASHSADTANWTQECRSQNCTLNSKCNTKVAGGLAAQTCQFDRPCTNLAWCSTQEDQEAWNGPPLQPPSAIYKAAAKSVNRPRSWHNTARG